MWVVVFFSHFVFSDRLIKTSSFPPPPPLMFPFHCPPTERESAHGRRGARTGWVVHLWLCYSFLFFHAHISSPLYHPPFFLYEWRRPRPRRLPGVRFDAVRRARSACRGADVDVRGRRERGFLRRGTPTPPLPSSLTPDPSTFPTTTPACAASRPPAPPWTPAPPTLTPPGERWPATWPRRRGCWRPRGAISTPCCAARARCGRGWRRPWNGKAERERERESGCVPQSVDDNEKHRRAGSGRV